MLLFKKPEIISLSIILKIIVMYTLNISSSQVKEIKIHLIPQFEQRLTEFFLSNV